MVCDTWGLKISDEYDWYKLRMVYNSSKSLFVSAVFNSRSTMSQWIMKSASHHRLRIHKWGIPYLLNRPRNQIGKQVEIEPRNKEGFSVRATVPASACFRVGSLINFHPNLLFNIIVLKTKEPRKLWKAKAILLTKVSHDPIFNLQIVGVCRCLTLPELPVPIKTLLL